MPAFACIDERQSTLLRAGLEDSSAYQRSTGKALVVPTEAGLAGVCFDVNIELHCLAADNLLYQLTIVAFHI